MFVVDTNVLSELGRPDPDPNAIGWLRRRDGDLLLPAVVVAELAFGVERMVPGRRRTALRELYSSLFSRLSSSIVPFGPDESFAAGDLLARAEAAGRPMSSGDAQVAATARCRGAAIATRHGLGYEVADLPVIDPFDPALQGGATR